MVFNARAAGGGGSVKIANGKVSIQGSGFDIDCGFKPSVVVFGRADAQSQVQASSVFLNSYMIVRDADNDTITIHTYTQYTYPTQFTVNYTTKYQFTDTGLHATCTSDNAQYPGSIYPTGQWNWFAIG